MDKGVTGIKLTILVLLIICSIKAETTKITYFIPLFVDSYLLIHYF